MNVEKISVDLKTSQWLMPEIEDSKIFDLLTFNCSDKRLSDFDSLKWYIYNPSKPRSNFFTLGSNGSLIFDDLVYNSDLLTFFEMSGQIIPIKTQTENFYILNVTECVNCLNNNLTKKSIYEDGTTGRILEYYFHVDRWSESSIFKIPETSKTEILTYSNVKDAENEFISAYKRNSFTGLVFKQLWIER